MASKFGLRLTRKMSISLESVCTHKPELVYFPKPVSKNIFAFLDFIFFTCLFFSFSTSSTWHSPLFLCFFLYDLSYLSSFSRFRIYFFICFSLVFPFFKYTTLLFSPFPFMRSLYFLAFSLVGTLTYAYAKKDKNEWKKEKNFTSLFNIECPLNLTRISAPLVFSKGTIRRERSAERYRKLYMDRTRIRRSKNLCRGFSISWS